MPETLPMRSWLFAPGDAARKMEKCADSAADIALFDLEDAVTVEQKPAARTLVREFLQGRGDDHARLWVRINPVDGPFAVEDLAAVMPGRPGGIMLPKARGRGDVELLDHYLTALEAANGIEQGTTKVIALVTEAAEAMFTTGDYRDAPRLVGMTWGAEDLADALGASTNRDTDGDYAFTYKLARSLCLIGAASAGVLPIETIHGDFRDLDGLRARAEKVRAEGYRGMLAIHPAQVEIINAAFTPSEQEIAEAQEIVAIFAANPGVGAIGYKGGMLDRPYLARAETVLRLAGRA
ncbi:HpcH/HpaI aldolase/citrate lyase family protein [Novosphingobium mangrovi (ex Hu et al. 2023)]|uniref:CoA ester lyase n=1 Tax=Novosphingobium mangrovi (ex Hu et al. 2023) TaxID=2930094 RepID=A0ABT0AGN4_9SPHN|nr:CoA ester lyase [Novosphingobium mangrovi (ex Hu et al. 2023)]MCJ1962348.1 CoA ester lyase [Novosphingobium mangrovi (ex Hu et al. 2023)]